MTEQPMERPECDHHWITYMQPSAGLSWIRQCSQCRDFDADDLQEQIAAAEQRGAARAVKAIRKLADENRGYEWLHPEDHLNELADWLEGDDE